MKIYRPMDFTGDRAWQALDIERFNAATVRLHWTDQPYRWHVNDGPEVFVVLQGEVQMYVRDACGEHAHHLCAGDIFHAQNGDQHVACPVAEARVLVIETPGSV